MVLFNTTTSPEENKAHIHYHRAESPCLEATEVDLAPRVRAFETLRKTSRDLALKSADCKMRTSSSFPEIRMSQDQGPLMNDVKPKSGKVY